MRYLIGFASTIPDIAPRTTLNEMKIFFIEAKLGQSSPFLNLTSTLGVARKGLLFKVITDYFNAKLALQR